MKNLLTLLFFLSVSFNLKATQYCWSPSSGNWSTTSNWKIGTYGGSSNGTIPGSGDTVRIGNISSSATITLDIIDTISVLFIEGSGQVFINTSTSKTLFVKGNIFVPNTSTTGGGSATIFICGTSGQTLTGNSSTGGVGKLPNVTINCSSLTLSGYITMGGSTTLDYVAGTISYGTSKFIFYYNNTITGTFGLNKVEFQGNNSTDVISNTLTVNDTLFLTGSSLLALNTGTINAEGSLIDNNSYTSNAYSTGTILFNGTGNQAITSTIARAHGFLPQITITKSSGTMTINGVVSCGGTGWTNTYSSAISMGTSEVYFAPFSSVAFTISGSTTFYKLTLAGGSTFSFAQDSAAIVTDTFLLTGPYHIICNNHSVVIKGTLEDDNTYSTNTYSTTAFIFNGSGNQTINSTVPRGEGFLPQVTITKSSGTSGTYNWTYPGSWTASADGATLHITNASNFSSQYVSVSYTSEEVTVSNRKPILFSSYDSDSRKEAVNDTLDNVLVYPNPSSEEFTIILPNSNTGGTLKVCDITGKVIICKKVSNQVEQIDLGDRPNGIYILKIESNNNSFVKKIEVLK